MNFGLELDNENNTVRLVQTDDSNPSHMTVSKGNFNPLQKWETLKNNLKDSFGEPEVLGEDQEHYSFQTLRYSQGPWVHMEPCEFLIDVNGSTYSSENAVDELKEKVKEIVEKSGYEIDGYMHNDVNRLCIRVPF